MHQTATTPKPKKGRVYTCSDWRRGGLTVLVEKASHSTGFAHVVNDLGRRYQIRMDRLNPTNHWHYAGEARGLVGTMSSHDLKDLYFLAV